jgi:hypothetical protein
MGLKHSPIIVTNGLVLCLDAGNSRSYPGSGTTWTDLSGRGNTGTLTNGPTYSSANGGSLSFDGVDDYVSTNLNTGSTTFGSSGFTFNIILKATDDGVTDVRRPIIANTTYPSSGFMFGYNHDLSNTNYWQATFYPGVNNSFGTLTPNFGNIEFITFLYDGNTDIKLYRNGVLSSTITSASTKTYLDTGTLLIGNATQGGWSTFLGNIYLVQGYNRALTEAEIQQNYNALKGRFGL